MKKLLIFSSEFLPGAGGMGTHAYQLAKNFKEMGWEVCVVTNQNYANGNEILEFNKKQPFKIIHIKSMPGPVTEGFYRISKLNAAIRDWKPDFAFATGNRSVWLGSVIFKFHQIPWAAIGHGGEFGVTPALEKYFTRRSYGNADSVISVSQYTQSRMRQMGIDAKDERVIPNGADDIQFFSLKDFDKKEFLKSQGINANHLLLTVGSVTERKGQEIVIKALPKVMQRFAGVHYVMAGMPKEKARYQKLAQDLKIEEHVHFLETIDHSLLLKWLNACDLFLLTSRTSSDGDFEGYGISVIEAGLCRKPAIVSTCGGLPEAVIRNQTGLIVPENDPEATAEAILHLLENPDKKLKMGEAAYERAKRQTWKNAAKEYERIFLEILSKKQS